jgi:hypothetical protein
MKKLYWLFLSLLLGLAACQTAPPAGFTSKEGRFSIQLSAAPAEKVRSATTRAGQIDIHLFVHDENNVRYILSYNDFPPVAVAAIDPERLFDSTRDGVVSGYRGKLLTETSIRLDGKYPGREIQVVSGDGAHAMRSRMFMVNNRLYQVAVALPRAELDSRPALAFLDSFRAWE